MKNDVSKKKTSKEKRVLIAALCIAATVAAGSTFAWFSSSDEVTNRLSANAAYDVTIAEDFTPPENWIPGQTIEKNVAVVNTGNTDAFVRTWLEGEMNLLAKVDDKAKWVSSSSKFADGSVTDVTGSLTATTDETLKKAGMTYYYSDGTDTVYLKELAKTIYANPNDPTAAQNNPNYFNEIQAVQAGGALAYLKTEAAAGDTVFIYKPNNSNTFKSKNGVTYEVDGGKQYTVKLDASTSVLSGDDIKVDGTNIIVDSETTIIKYLGEHIDSDNFYPAATGLYLFRRNINITSTSTADYEFAGYYYKKSGSETGWNTDSATSFGNQGHYFALQNENDSSLRSDYVVPTDAVAVTENNDGTITVAPTAKLALYTVKQNVIENNALDWTYYKEAAFYQGAAYYTDGTNWYPVGSNTAVTDSTIISALGSATASPMFLVTDGNGIKIDIALADTVTDAAATNVADAEKWTPINADGVVSADSSDASYDGTGKPITFYYNNDVEEGTTTSRLVDSVTLDSTVTQNDFIAFDFDLNVFMDSVQVTIGDDGTERAESVNPWAANGGNGNTAVAAKGTKGNAATDTEITYVTWAKP